MIVYVWSRHNPDTPVSLMGVIQLKAFWLPWALMLLTMLMGGSPVADFLGILVGHLYYFLSSLHPAAGGGDYVRTPAWFKRSIDHVYGGYGFVNPNYQAPRAPRAFGGRGRRLAD
jgi:Derlin-2/3